MDDGSFVKIGDTEFNVEAQYHIVVRLNSKRSAGCDLVTNWLTQAFSAPEGSVSATRRVLMSNSGGELRLAADRAVALSIATRNSLVVPSLVSTCWPDATTIANS